MEDPTHKSLGDLANATPNQLRAALRHDLFNFAVAAAATQIPAPLVPQPSTAISEASVALALPGISAPPPKSADVAEPARIPIYCMFNGGITLVAFVGDVVIPE
jgi:hypothetical protein